MLSFSTRSLALALIITLAGCTAAGPGGVVPPPSDGLISRAEAVPPGGLATVHCGKPTTAVLPYDSTAPVDAEVVRCTATNNLKSDAVKLWGRTMVDQYVWSVGLAGPNRESFIIPPGQTVDLVFQGSGNTTIQSTLWPYGWKAIPAGTYKGDISVSVERVEPPQIAELFQQLTELSHAHYQAVLALYEARKPALLERQGTGITRGQIESELWIEALANFRERYLAVLGPLGCTADFDAAITVAKKQSNGGGSVLPDACAKERTAVYPRSSQKSVADVPFAVEIAKR